MRTPLLLVAGAALLLAGCCSNKSNTTHNAGTAGPAYQTETSTVTKSSPNYADHPGFEYGTSAGRGQGMENNLGVNDPRGGWENWRFGGDTDRIPPKLPVSKHVTPIEPNYPFEKQNEEATAESANPSTVPPGQKPSEPPVFELQP